MTKPIFEGLKVCDFAWIAMGAQVARELALHGATVVRVESHRKPDGLRLSGPFKDFRTGIDRTAFYCAHNTQKLGISLDYSRAKGQEVARRLVQWADVVTDSMTPGTLAKWGLDYESVARIKPDIVYFSTSQMGKDGPFNKFGSYGDAASAYCGFSQTLGYTDRTPLRLTNAYIDYVAPWYLITALVGALLYRRKTGKGVYLEQSQIESGMTMMGPEILDYAANGRIAGRMGNHDHYMCPHNAYPCQGEDKWIVIAVRTDDEWKGLCRVMGLPAWSGDAKFATILARKENEDELDRLIGNWTGGNDVQQLMETLQSARIPAGIIRNGEGIVNDPQMRHRQAFRWLEHSVMGSTLYKSPSYQLSKTPPDIRKAAPCLGEDNQYVYRDILGYSDDEISDMLVDGTITTDDDLPFAVRQ